MIKVLIDTTGANLEIALISEEKSDYMLKEGLKHSLTLLPALDEILIRNGLKVSDIDALGVVNGPGSFTGIRVGISTVKAISYALDIPVFSVNSLRITAYNADTEGAVIAISDAANGYAYIAVYENDTELLAPQCLTVAELEKFLSETEETETVAGYPFENNSKKKGMLTALSKADENIFTKENGILPLYIRKPQAEEIKNQIDIKQERPV